MELRNLRGVVAVRRHGSFAKAAEALGISQPSLSKAIGRLEDQLKVKLFNRTAQGSELTPIGEIVATRAERLLAEQRDLLRDVALVAGGEIGMVRLGVGTALRDALVSPLLLEISKQHPRLDFVVDAGEGDQLLPRLAARELDLVICAHRPSASEDGLIATDLFTTVGRAYAAPHHPLAAEHSISRERLGQFRGVGSSGADFINSAMLGLDLSTVTTLVI